MKNGKLVKIVSLYDLKQKALAEPAYLALAISAAKNLGGMNIKDLDSAMRWLRTNADETGSEKGVVAEINFCR